MEATQIVIEKVGDTYRVYIEYDQDVDRTDARHWPIVEYLLESARNTANYLADELNVPVLDWTANVIH